MIVIDTSVVIAIILSEPEARDFTIQIGRTMPRLLPASCYLEAVMVLWSRPGRRQDVDGLIEEFRIDIVGSDARQARIAADAFERFGRGTGHPAKLNFGDCLSYAAAAARDAPLLFKGEDFTHTDVSRFV